MTSDLPTGTLTFLFTDIEGSTQLWERHLQDMQAALARHDALLAEAIAAHSGYIVKHTGDGCHAVFAAALDGVLAALDAQQALSAEAWSELAPDVLRARMALHTGEAETRDGDYFGPALNRAARLMAIGHGGQILLSELTAGLVRDRLPAEASLRDLGEHRLKDLTRPEHIFQLSGLGLPADFPAVRSLNSSTHNLPVQLTHFIGREREMVEVRQLLSETALLTFTGSGGTGKTRLSLQLAAELLPKFPDGAWLVELAPVTDPDLVMPTIAAVLGARQQPGRTLFDALSDFLRGKQLLLILDNCEHLITACADVAEGLLRQCSRLKLLASSREALGIAGETTYPVPSLSLPAAGPPDAAALAGSEAVRLFVDRARAALPGFALTDENTAAITTICRRLDGIPLAIELAAVRVRLLSVEQIAARLDDRFRLLTGGSRNALPRQQTLRALIDWSYALLAEPERALLQQLTVFAGGWTLEAAEAVCGHELDVLELLTQLFNKSLIVVERAGTPETRYGLLETIRQYAREKLLDAAGSAPALWRERHLRYFLAYAEQGEPELLGPRMLGWLNRYEQEHDNFRAALEWALETDPLAAVELASALGFFWSRRGYVSEGLGWLETTRARVEAARLAGQGMVAAVSERQYQLARARALGERARLDLGMVTNGPAARAAAEESARLARQWGSLEILRPALGALALTAAFWGGPAQARAAAEEALALSRETGDAWAIFARSALLATDFMFTHDLDEARRLVAEQMPLARRLNNRWILALVVSAAARLAMVDGHLDAAIDLFLESARLLDEVGDSQGALGSRSEVAHMLRRHGRPDEALALYGETLRSWQRIGHRGSVAHQLENLAFLALAGAQTARAARLLGQAEALRAASNSLMMAPEHAEYDQALTALRAQLSQPELDLAWAEGRAMAMDESITYALGDARL